nr:classical arabinogalactan protein 9-like [Pseudochaenichthys georgianus]
MDEKLAGILGESLLSGVVTEAEGDTDVQGAPDEPDAACSSGVREPSTEEPSTEEPRASSPGVSTVPPASSPGVSAAPPASSPGVSAAPPASSPGVSTAPSASSPGVSTAPPASSPGVSTAPPAQPSSSGHVLTEAVLQMQRETISAIHKVARELGQLRNVLADISTSLKELANK